MTSLFLSPAPHSAAAADYCRRARRLRARLGGDPANLQVALRELARTEDRRAGNDDALERVASAARSALGPAQLFSAHVSAALGDGVLRYSARKELLRQAAQMGLGSFEATLLIAAVQHGEPRRVRTTPCNPPPTSTSSSPLIALTAIGLQTAIAAAVWWVLHT